MAKAKKGSTATQESASKKSASTGKASAAKGSAAKGSPMDLSYTLAELPSSQHRAGLAGLVGMVDWLERQSLKKRGVCRIKHLDARGLTLEIDQQGMRDLFDQVYAASKEEQGYGAPFKGKDPLRIEEVVVEEKVKAPAEGAAGEPSSAKKKAKKTAAKAKTKTKKLYYYPVTVPRGAYVVEFDEAANDAGNGPWIKLWRDMVWSILRGVPATRRPFEDREEGPGTATKDADGAWATLQRGDVAVDLPSTYFLGAQSATAENVPFKDRARYQFLLHFWPFIAQIYVPTTVDHEGKRNHQGFAIAVPDVAALDLFAEELPRALVGRDNDIAGYRPRGCLVDLSLEGALDLFSRLKKRLQQRQANAVSDLVFGIDVFHMAKEGNNVRVLGAGRIDPDEAMINEFQMIQGVYWSPIFRRQRLINLIARKPWYSAFERLFATTAWSQTIGNKHFKHDAREAFTREVRMSNDDETDDATPPTLEGVIYKMVSIYISRKVKGKYDLEYEDAKTKGKLDDYRTAREKVAREAFLAARSRTGGDFVEFFTSTLCSVPQRIKESEYRLVSEALLDPSAVEEKIRPLTMLALSARG